MRGTWACGSRGGKSPTWTGWWNLCWTSPRHATAPTSMANPTPTAYRPSPHRRKVAVTKERPDPRGAHHEHHRSRDYRGPGERAASVGGVVSAGLDSGPGRARWD